MRTGLFTTNRIYNLCLLACVFYMTSLWNTVDAQIILAGQYRVRAELRQGQGTLPQNSSPAFFISQRTRVMLGYTASRMTFFTSLQDVRVWGQDVSTINRTSTDVNDGLLFHEAWADILLSDTSSSYQLNLKIGRQELVYNDARLLGNLDWLQQARRHELALLKFSKNKFTGHAGFAFNQNKEAKSGTIYNGTPAAPGYPAGYSAGTNGIGTMYKSMQFIYLGTKLKSGTISFLVLKDDFNKYSLSGNSIAYRKGVWSRITGGTDLGLTISKKLKIHNSLCYQGGKDKTGKDLSAYLGSLYAIYSVNPKFSLAPGIDITSGNDGTKVSKQNNAFDPLYGTAHKFWGYMDYFYAGDPFGNRGLRDYYLKLKYSMGKSLLFSLDLHEFYSQAKVENSTTPEADHLSPRLGTELDFIANFSLSNTIQFEGGYGIMLGTSTLDKIKQPAVDKKNIGHWAYLMISIKPELFKSVL